MNIKEWGTHMKNYCQIVNEHIEKMLNNFKTKEEIIYIIKSEMEEPKFEQFRDEIILRTKYGFLPTPKDPVIMPPCEVFCINYFLDFIMIYEEMFKPEYKIPFEFFFTRARQERREFKMLRFPQIRDFYRERRGWLMRKFKSFYGIRLDKYAFEKIICDRDLESHKIKYQTLKEFLNVREDDVRERHRLEKEFFLKFSFASVEESRKEELHESFQELTDHLLQKYLSHELEEIENRLLNLEIMFNDII